VNLSPSPLHRWAFNALSAHHKNNFWNERKKKMRDELVSTDRFSRERLSARPQLGLTPHERGLIGIIAAPVKQTWDVQPQSVHPAPRWTIYGRWNPEGSLVFNNRGESVWES